jgi:regulator of RNase E activity RraA
MSTIISEETLVALRSIDSCAVANAIETFDVRLRNEGFTGNGLRSRFVEMPPMVGYAATIRVRASAPPARGRTYLDRTDWWKYLQSWPVPHVIVIEDMDAHPGCGAFVGEVHAAILKALGCVGAVTNGAVRDLPAIRATGFSLFSRHLSVSHAYVHVVEFGTPVDVAGLRIRPGDLLHGDLHGLIRVPLAIAEEIPAAVDRLRERERRIIDYCHHPAFSVSGLRELLTTEEESSATDEVR